MIKAVSIAPGKERRPWTKGRFIAVYWLCQALVGYALCATFTSGTFGEWLSTLFDPGYVLTIVPVLLFFMAAQGVLLTRVRKPVGPIEGWLGRWVRSATGGLAAGAMASYLAVAVWLMLDALEIKGLAPDVRWPWPLLVPCLVVAPVVTVLLAWRFRNGLPVLLTLSIAACLAASLVAGLVLAVGSLLTTGLGPRQTLLAHSDAPYQRWFVGAVITLVTGWVVATPLLWVFVRGKDRETAVARLSSRLFLGTIIEVAAIIPMDVMVRRKASCYCAEGTLWALAMCWGVGTIVFGPYLWLVPMMRRRKRWLQGRCEVCDYDMRGCMEALCCPECGAGWRRPWLGTTAEEPGADQRR